MYLLNRARSSRWNSGTHQLVLKALVRVSVLSDAQHCWPMYHDLFHGWMLDAKVDSLHAKNFVMFSIQIFSNIPGQEDTGTIKLSFFEKP